MRLLSKFFKKSKSTNGKSLVKICFGQNILNIDLNNNNNNIDGLVPVYYWDSVPNFGDVVGPYLISKITGKIVININVLKKPGIMAVGSILQMLDRENMVVWGSGLISEPSKELKENFIKYNPEILSVRGQKTANFLSELGMNVPDKKYYGDPALILPLYYKPSIKKVKKNVVCPHYIHKEHFFKNMTLNDEFSIIDVQKNLEEVVDAIASSKVCISTSLHGIIIAQAYDIPWVWLEICDNNLTGNEFKFKDFFSTIDESQVTHIKIKMEDVENLDFANLAKRATLPNKFYNEKLILEVLVKYLERTHN